MDNDDNSKDCTSDTAEDKILLDKNDTGHMDTVDIKHIVDIKPTVDIKPPAELISETSENLK